MTNTIQLTKTEINNIASDYNGILIAGRVNKAHELPAEYHKFVRIELPFPDEIQRIQDGLINPLNEYFREKFGPDEVVNEYRPEVKQFVDIGEFYGWIFDKGLEDYSDNIEEFYEETGMYYITSKKRLLETGIRYSGKIGIVNIPSYDSLQIDSKEDLEFVERILKSI